MNKNRKLMIAAAGVLVAVVAAFSLFGEDPETYEFFTSEVTLGTIQNTVVATGVIEPVVTVEVGSQVSGQIQALYADYNSVVRAGQLLAKLDPRDIEAQVENSRASLLSARSRVRTAEADLVNSRANLTSARASLAAARAEAEKADVNLRRSQELIDAELLSLTDLENARVSAEAARARLAQAEASLEQAEAQIVSREAAIEQAHAAVVQAEADLNRNQVNLEYTEIRSPVDGVVISREVDVGQTVAASMSAPVLFQIANDLAQMRASAAIDEADIGRLAQNNEVDFTVDAYPNQRFRGQIEEIRLNPQTTQNVVTYNVIVGVDNRDMRLKPGMTANITVTVDRRDNVLSLPNTALRYMPPNVDPASLVQVRTDLAVNGRSAAAGTTADGAPAGGGQGPVGFGRGGFDPAALGGRGMRGAADTPPAAPSRITEIASAQTLGQLWDPGEKIQFQAMEAEPPRPGRIWVLNALGVPEMRAVMVGITDGSRTEIVAGEIQAGDRIIVGDSSQGAATTTTPAFGGRGGFPGGGAGFRMVR